MLIEQIIEFESRGPGPHGRTCTSTTGDFHGKTKFSIEYLRVDLFIIYCLNFEGGNVTCNKIYPKMQDVKRVLDLNCK